MTKKNLSAMSLALAFGLSIFSVHAKSDADIPLDEIRNFVDIYNTIRNEYVEEKDGKKLIDYAIKGMLNGLDPHSVYLDKSDLEDVKDSADGSYIGYGVQIEMVDGKLIIISPIPGSPAEEVGLKPNDHIVKIDDTVIENMSMPEVSRMLKESDGVTLTVTRKGEETQQFELTKSTINLPSVTQKMLDKDYGYIRVSQFQMETSKQFDEALSELLDKNIKGLVLDLRNNPGGLVIAATAIADSFLDAGLIVSTKNQNTGNEEKVHANKETVAKELPLVVLINEGSASASELLAGALQSHKRAVIVGQQSFGKGSVQEVIPLDNGSAIKLTIARYYTPSGESIQAKGITPDIMLSQLTVDDKDESLLAYGEANIPKHLGNDKNKADNEKSDENNKNTQKEMIDKADKADKTKDKQKSDNVDESDSLAKSDLQLFEALNVLKVLIFKQ